MFFNIRYDRHTIFAAHVFDFERRFRDMDVQRHVEFLGGLGSLMQDFPVWLCQERAAQWMARSADDLSSVEYNRTAISIKNL